MAPPAGTLRVGRYFLALIAILAALYAIVFWPGARHTPKLGLDLEGGTQIIFTARTPNGQSPSGTSMSEAQQIMEERVNGTGVSEATVVVQGSDQLVVSIPGSTTTDVSKLGAAAVLNFRGLVAPAVPVACAAPRPSSSGSASPPTSPSPSAGSSAPAKAQPTAHSTQDAGARRLGQPAAAAPTPSTTPKPTGSASATPSGSTTAQAPACTATPFAALIKSGVKIPTSEAAYQALPAAQQQQIQAALANFDCASGQDEKDEPNNYFIACDTSGLAYLLGSVIVPGHEIDTAQAVAPSFSQGGSSQWTVSLELKSGGQAAWGKYTSAHNIGGGSANNAGSPQQCSPSATPCADYVGFTLDGIVVSIPVNVSAINGGATQISGNFTQTSATDLANKLKYGALPLSFKADQAQTVSPTLGSSQLKSGLLAGGIGLVLVIIYSLLYYRALGLVTIASLCVSGALVYGSLVLLGTQIGFTLSLAGIAGFIVAVGITADSFVVFFERIKDEVHEGRSARVAIPRAWTRARRTILSADTVSFLAAAILYYFAAGDVKGFAFTLGLSTILDLVVVFLFTHPLVSFLSRFRAFGSKRFTGLDAVREPVPATAAPKRERVGAAARSGGGAAGTATATVTLEKPRIDDEDEPDEATTGTEVDEAGDQMPATERSNAAERAAARRARLREKGER